MALLRKHPTPTAVETLIGYASKAHRELGWKPVTTFDELVQEMIASNLSVAEHDALVIRHSYRAYSLQEA